MQDITDNPYMIMIISMVWGLGLAILFRKICDNDNCVIVKVPPQFIDDRSIYDAKQGCFQLTRYNSSCS